MEKIVEFKVGEETLRGSLFIPNGKGPFPSVVFFHGDRGRGEKYFEAGNFLVKKGYLCLAFNYRGHGLSDGKFSDQTLENSIEDGSKAVEFLLKQKESDNQRLGAVGGSYGGFISSMLTQKVKFRSLVLAMPAARPEPLKSKIDRGHIADMDYYLSQANWKNSKSYENIANFHGALLVIRSENDKSIPSEVVDKYFNEGKKSSIKEFKILKRADHRLSTPEMRKDFFKLISDWFLETL